MHNIATVTHLSATAQDGYGPDAPVKLTYLDGRPDAISQWGSDVEVGGVLAWRAEHGDEAALPYEAPPAPVPGSISRRQLILALTAMDLITGEEALAAARTGDVPAAVQATFDNLPPADKLAAEVTWATMSIAERSHPLVAMLAVANGMSEQDVNDFFRLAAGL